MFDWFKKEKEKEEDNSDPIILVKTIEYPLIEARTKDTRHMYVYLYESKSGHRTHEVKASGNFLPDDIRFIPAYFRVVISWLKGQNFSDIPSYWDIVKERRQDDIKRMYKRFFEVK